MKIAHRKYWFWILLIGGILTYVLPEWGGGVSTTTAAEKAQTAPRTSAVHYELPRVTDGRREQVIEHVGYTVSYNPKWLIPNWVAYELTREEVQGTEGRSNKFLPDPQVRGYAVVTKDYSHSGYDRGHMAPAADMKWSEQAMRESFYMTNICPQHHSNNAGDWKDLEELVRDYATRFGRVYVACGPVVEPGYETIGTTHRIVVPQRFYKVLLREKKNGWAAVGWVQDNAPANRPLMTYLKTVDEVEALTGIDFFSALPDSIEQQVEADYDLRDWTL